MTGLIVYAQLYRNNINHTITTNIKDQLDTLTLAKSVMSTITRHKQIIPENYKLSTLYEYITEMHISNAHRVNDDITTTLSILCHTMIFMVLICTSHVEC